MSLAVIAAIEDFKRQRGNVQTEIDLIQMGLVKPDKPAEAMADLRRRRAELDAILANALGRNPVEILVAGGRGASI
jgi:hypothetical protein